MQSMIGSYRPNQPLEPTAGGSWFVDSKPSSARRGLAPSRSARLGCRPWTPRGEKRTPATFAPYRFKCLALGQGRDAELATLYGALACAAGVGGRSAHDHPTTPMPLSGVYPVE